MLRSILEGVHHPTTAELVFLTEFNAGDLRVSPTGVPEDRDSTERMLRAAPHYAVLFGHPSSARVMKSWTYVGGIAPARRVITPTPTKRGTCVRKGS